MSYSLLEKAEEDVEVYHVTLEKSDDKLGLAYRLLAPHGLLITGIIPGSPADEWNRHYEVEQVDCMICVGDQVLDVNGQTDPRSMVDELVDCASAKLHLRKTGPRWHLRPAEEAAADAPALARPQSLYAQQASQLSVEPEPHDRSLGCSSLLLMLFLVALPNLVIIAFFSDMGFGLKVYSFFATHNYNLLGNMVIGTSCLLGVTLYIFDWSKWQNPCQKVGMAVAVLYLFSFGWLLKSRVYPQAPLVIFLFHLPAFLGLLRRKAFRSVPRSSFYLASAGCTFLVALAIMAAWLSWMFVDSIDGVHMYTDETKDQLIRDSVKMYERSQVEINGEKRSLDYDLDCKQRVDADFRLEAGLPAYTGHVLSAEERNDRSKACAQVKTTWFLTWLSPFICSAVNFVICIFCLVNGIWLNIEDASKLEKVLKHFIIMIAVLMLTMWVSASIAGASMRLTGTLMAFCGAALLALFIWIYLEISKQAITSAVRNSPIMQSLVALATSDWVRAMLIIGLNILIPSFLVINMLTERVRKMRGLSNSDAWFTKGADKVIVSIANWRWSSIFIKANWLVILYWTLSIGVAKITYVFLSWLNETLLQVDFAVVLVTFFMIGYTMFLLPPVPGIPVYICSGIVVAARARPIEGIGFWGGTAIAVFLSLALKLAAVCGQYMIGFFMGKSVKIQQLVAVDKVFTRSIEMILKRRGICPSKVSVLVGGPDWPTSVLCGILRLNLFQCVLGTVPVILVSTPCVLAGAFMSGPDEPSEGAEDSGSSSTSSSIWSTLASTMLAVSALGQLASGVIALYYIQEVIYKHGKELAEARPEHAPVVALTQQEAEYVQIYDDVSDWRALTPGRRLLVLMSTMTMLLSLFIFMFMDEACFRPFQVNSSIGAPYDENGLNGNPVSIVKMPGWGAMGLFFLACVLHGIFLRWATSKATKILKNRGQEVVPGIALQ